MGYEAVRARLNLLAVLPNLEDVVRYDPEAADLVKGARITIQFVVAGGPRAFVRIAGGACTVSPGMAPGVQPMRMVRGARGASGRDWPAASGGGASAGASGGLSSVASPSAGASTIGAEGAKEATVVLGFASCAHLNKMFDGKGNPVPLWGFTKIGFLTGTFTKLTERMAYFLKPTDDGKTRLIERFRAKTPGNAPANVVLGEIMGTGIVLMARKQMLGIKERVERPIDAVEETTDQPTGSHEPQIDIPQLIGTDTPNEPSFAG